MSKKSNIAVSAFIAIVISAVAYLLSNILPWLGLCGIICWILNLISILILFIWALIAAYPFVKNNTVAVKVIYWVSVIIVIIGVVFKFI